MKMIGVRQNSEHCVIQGVIEEVTATSEGYIVRFDKVRHKRPNVSSDFDDIGKRAITEQYHYQQKLFN